MNVGRGQPAGEASRGFGGEPPEFLTRRARGAQEPAAAAPAEKVRLVPHAEAEAIASHLEGQAHEGPHMQSGGASHADFQPQRPYEGVPITPAQAAQVASDAFGFVVVQPKDSALRTYAASFGRIALATAAISALTAGVGIAIGEGAHIMTIPAAAGASAALFAQPLRAIGQGIIDVVKRPFQKMAEAKAQREAQRAERQESRAEPTVARGRREEIHAEPHMGDLDAAVAAHRSEPTAETPEVRIARGSEEPPAQGPVLTEGAPSAGARARVVQD